MLRRRKPPISLHMSPESDSEANLTPRLNARLCLKTL
jgi:hypothetical protein